MVTYPSRLRLFICCSCAIEKFGWSRSGTIVIGYYIKKYKGFFPGRLQTAG